MTPLGWTGASLGGRAECGEACGGWRLRSYTALLQVDVMIRNDLKLYVEEWVRRSESEHVFDFMAGVDRMY
jgi:hypothetical protein